MAHPLSVDDLAAQILKLVDAKQKHGASRAECFAAIWAVVGAGEPLPASRRAEESATTERTLVLLR